MRTIDKILYQEAKSNILNFTLIIFLMLLLVGFDVIAPWPFKILIDNVLSANPIVPGDKFGFLFSAFQSRYLLGVFVVCIYFLSTFGLANVEYIKSIFTKRVIKNLTSQFSKNAFKNLQSIAIGFYKKQQIGDYIYRLSYDVSALGEFLEDGMIPLVTSLLYLLITMTIMVLIDVKLTLLSFIVLPFLAVTLYSFNTYVSRATKRSEFFNSAAFAFIEEALTHLKIIQAFSQEHREVRAFEEKINTSLKSDMTVFYGDFLITLLMGVLIAISYSVIILYGIQAVFAHTLTTGLLVVFIFYLDNLTQPILQIIYSVTALRQSYIKVVRMEDFFTAETHLTQTGTFKTIATPGITFHHVTLLGDEGIKILDNISFEIKPETRKVIFGVNGSGKTSILNLILRFIEKPDSGSIFIDGMAIQDYNVKALRDSISFIPQEITLFNDTIYHNIAFGDPHASSRDIKKAAKLSTAHEFIQKLPERYRFRVGEGGNFLSGGQKQRLMLARALVKKDAKILLFDETLSALDVKTRKEVIRNIYTFSEGKTTIIVSNIFSVITASDNVIVLNQGKVIYTGSSSRLTKEISLYKLIVEND